MAAPQFQRTHLLSIRAAAQQSGISYHLLRDAVKAGQLKAVSVGRGYPKIPRSVLTAFLADLNRPASQRTQVA